MALDEPLDAVEATFEAEARASSPLARYIRPASVVLGLVSKVIPGLNLVDALAKAASTFIEKQTRDRFECVLSVLVEDVKRVNAKRADIGKVEQDRKEFQQEFPTLVLDGLRKAEQTRAMGRVQRLGHILGYAYQEGPRQPLDLAEELKRVAISLDEQDILRCRGCVTDFGRIFHSLRDWSMIGIRISSGGKSTSMATPIPAACLAFHRA
jgi:hypothetical protein